MFKSKDLGYSKRCPRTLVYGKLLTLPYYLSMFGIVDDYKTLKLFYENIRPDCKQFLQRMKTLPGRAGGYGKCLFSPPDPSLPPQYYFSIPENHEKFYEQVHPNATLRKQALVPNDSTKP